MELGFIGLGRMGRPMAARLIEAGHRLIVFDTRQDSVASLTALGAHEASSPAEIADRVETVMACLPTPDVVFEVATGERGVIKGKRVRSLSISPPPAYASPSASLPVLPCAGLCRSTAR